MSKGSGTVLRLLGSVLWDARTGSFARHAVVLLDEEFKMVGMVVGLVRVEDLQPGLRVTTLTGGPSDEGSTRLVQVYPGKSMTCSLPGKSVHVPMFGGACMS